MATKRTHRSFRLSNDIYVCVPITSQSVMIANGGGQLATKILSDADLNLIVEEWRKDFFAKAGKVDK